MSATANYESIWSQLIGDGAHSTLPDIGQGACQAFEDAYILARWLESERGNPTASIGNFQWVRIPRLHATERLSVAAARFKHLRDAEVLKALVDSGRASEHANMDWRWGFYPVTAWREAPVVPVF